MKEHCILKKHENKGEYRRKLTRLIEIANNNYYKLTDLLL